MEPGQLCLCGGRWGLAFPSRLGWAPDPGLRHNAFPLLCGPSQDPSNLLPTQCRHALAQPVSHPGEGGDAWSPAGWLLSYFHNDPQHLLHVHMQPWSGETWHGRAPARPPCQAGGAPVAVGTDLTVITFYLALTCSVRGHCNSAQGQSSEASLCAWWWLSVGGPAPPGRPWGRTAVLSPLPQPCPPSNGSQEQPLVTAWTRDRCKAPEGQSFTYPGHMTPLGTHAGK